MREEKFIKYLKTAEEFERVLKTQVTTDDLRNTNIQAHFKGYFDSDEVKELHGFIEENIKRLSQKFKIWDDNGVLTGKKLKQAIENDEVWDYFWHTEDLCIPPETRQMGKFRISINN
jgi:hypothetical protein